MKLLSETLSVCVLAAYFAFPVFASDITTEDIMKPAENLNYIHVYADTDELPEKFDKTISVYLSAGSAGIDISPLNGYDAERAVYTEEGTFDLTVFSPDDVLDQYLYALSQDTFEIGKDRDIKVTVTTNPTPLFVGEEENIQEAADTGSTTVEESYEEPKAAFYDYSNGTEETGTVFVHAKDYSVFESVTYRLIGSGVYDIVLDDEHGYSAEAVLPAGYYYESSTTNLEFMEWVPDPDEYGWKFVYRHTSHPGSFFASGYDLEAGGTVTIDDIGVYMVTQDGTAEVNADTMNQVKVAKESLAQVEEHEMKQLESAFPEIYGTEAETEPESESPTIPTAVPYEEEEPADVFEAFKIIGIAFIGVLLLFGIGAFIKKKREE